jgi:hypothetical protein
MGEVYAVGINQKTGKKEYYQRKADYIAGRARKQDSARKRRQRIMNRR